MKMRKLRTTVSTSFASGTRLTRWTNFCRHSWRPIPTASMVLCAMVVVAVAQNHSEKTKAQPTHKPPPYWAFAVGPTTDAWDAQAKLPVDDTRRHVPGSAAAFTLTQIGDFF